MARTPKPWFDKERKVWKVTIRGKRHNLGEHKQEAMDEFHRLMRQPIEQPSVNSQSLAAIFDAYLEWLAKHKSPATFEWYRYRLQRFIERHPDMRVDQLRVFHVQQWVDSYQIAKTTTRNYLRSVKRALSWATKQGYIDDNPIKHLEVPAGERREIVVSLAEYESILQHASNGLGDLARVTWQTGCRPQESLRVEARHVDIDHQRWVFPKNEAKGEKCPRVVYLTDIAFELTRRLMAAHPDGPLFRNAKGKPWTADAVNCAFDQVQIRMGKEEMKRQSRAVSQAKIQALIPKLRPYKTCRGNKRDKTPAELRCEAKVKLTSKLAKSLVTRYSLYALRHSWATHALESGIDSVTVAVLMGHNGDPSMLAKVYQHLGQNPAFLLGQVKRARA